MVIPKEWEAQAISSFPATVVSGGTPSTFVSKYWGGHIPWMSSGELNLKRVYAVEGRITLAGLMNSSTCKVPPMSVLIGLAGQGKTRGTVAINYFELCTNQSIASIMPNPEVFDSEYLYQNLDSRYDELRELSTGDGGRGGLNLTIIKNLTVPLPPLPEQRAIAAALSETDAYIAALEKLIAKKRAVKQGAMQELLTGKRRLPGFSGEWVEKSIGELFDISGGFSASRAQLSNKGYPYLHYGDIHGSLKTFVDVCDDITIPRLDIPLSRVSKASLLQDGDVVFVDASEDDEGASRHIVIRNADDMPFISGLHTIVAKSKVNDLNNRFREFCFQTSAVKAQFKFYAAGTKVVGVSKTNIKDITLYFPTDKKEQTVIAEVLYDMDAEIDALTAKLNKAKHIKQGMMSELLSGRIRLVEQETTAEANAAPKIVELPKPDLSASAEKGHNKAIEDAVILAVVADLYATEQYPLAPFYAQKFPYLLHRHMEGVAKGYHKLAAGPYSAELKYKTALPIAKKNKYITTRKSSYNGTPYQAILVGDNIEQARNFFFQWHGGEPLQWLEQFRYIKNRRDELELLTTVDMAMVELREVKKTVTVTAVKAIIQASEEWKAKLKREIFSDANIARAIHWSNQLFGTEA